MVESRKSKVEGRRSKAEILTFETGSVMPERAAVLEHQGVLTGRTVGAKIETLCDTVLGKFAEVAEPTGVLKGIDKSDFAAVYHGQGRNEPQTPVGDIFPQADRLALFAVTLGPRINREIAHRFESNDPALACMLDSAASVAADKLAEVVERRHFDLLAKAGKVGPGSGTLRYSPGYCGWDISGQGALFEFLRPEVIGITLRASFLMDPLKSVSGVVLVGPKQIHEFDDVYPFCSQCETRGCRERIDALKLE